MKLAFILGSFSVGSRPLEINNLWNSSRGLTGTELAIIMNAIEMSKLGHDVYFFSIFTEASKSDLDGIKLLPLESAVKTIDSSFDAVISYNEPDVFRGLDKRPLKIVSQMVNDFKYCQEGFDDFVDIYTSPSPMHMEYIQKLTPKPHKWQVIPLGCDPNLYSENKVPGRVVWTSSADRGLHLLLQEWPKIKAAVPVANLKVFYNFNFDSIISLEPDGKSHLPFIIEMANRARYIVEALKRLKPLDVEMVGSISKTRLVKEMNEAMILAYPVDTVNFTEGFSISIMEACASGTLPVISDCDCIGSIYGKVAPTIKSPAGKNISEFSDLVIRGLTDAQFHKETTDKCKEFAKEYSWANAALKLEKLLHNAGIK